MFHVCNAWRADDRVAEHCEDNSLVLEHDGEGYDSDDLA